jgi:hypothetical protein
MHFNTIALALIAAATASALPQTTPITDGTKFGAIIVQSGSTVDNSPVQSAQRSLFANLPAQNADCAAPTNSATFYIQNEELLLWTGINGPQKIFVDRSGMGMGKIGYVTGVEPIGSKWETKGWAVDANNELKFKGTGLQACPRSMDGGRSLWLQGVAKPGHNEDCHPVKVVANAIPNPIECVYTY